MSHETPSEVCFSLPARVVSVGASEFDPIEVDVAGERRRWTRLFVPELRVGDWCVAQNGHAVRQLTEAEALTALEAFRGVLAITQDVQDEASPVEPA